ncbi:MAG: hypothetical protein KJ066_04785 [Acidobacteria bacterium]|nr:hypothetical protein [Acidobacteriota bacterium]
MDEQRFEGRYGRPLVLDLCYACTGLWFDGLEALQLGPGATLALFELMDERQATSRSAISSRMSCPRCSGELRLTHDRQRETRFHYFRCPAGHGRFSTFFQFLRSRNFIRELSMKELNELRERIRSVNCSNCGAPVDVAQGAACGHCRTPISILDPGQLKRTMAELRDAETREQRGVDPALPLALAHERRQAERVFADLSDKDWIGQMLFEPTSAGLVEAGLHALVLRWRGLIGR